MKKRQNGFAPVETLLFAAIILIVAFIGWYVWHSKNKTDKSLNSTLNSSQNDFESSKNTQTNSSIPGPKLSLDDGSVTLSTPAGWSSSAPTGKCAITVYSKADCLDSLYVSPTDAAKAKTGDAFGAEVVAAAYSGSSNLKDWYWNTYQGGEIQTDEDTVSDSGINGYDAYSRTQTDKSFTDKYYVLHKGSVAVVIYARVLDTSFNSDGSISEQSDNTQYEPQIMKLVNSINIK